MEDHHGSTQIDGALDRPTKSAPSREQVESLPASARQLEKVEKQMTGFESATLRWAKVAVGMSFLAALFVCAQWYEMHEGGNDTRTLAQAADTQAKKMTDMSNAADKIREAAENMVWQDQRIADNAKQSLEASEKNSKTTLSAAVAQFREQQRAWVGVQGVTPSEGFTETEPWKVTVLFLNSGRVPARNVRFSTMYVTSPMPIAGPSADTVKQLAFRSVQSIAPQGVYRCAIGYDSAGEVSTDQQRAGQQVLISQYNLIKAKRLFLYYFGILKYDDGFGKESETQFCVTLADPNTKQSGMCDSFNDLN